MPNPALVAGTKNNAAIAAANTSVTVTSTGSVSAGHLQIVAIEVSGATAPTGITPPAGWTTLLATTVTETSGLVSAAIFYKLATTTGAFSGSFTWTTSSTGGEWLFTEWSGVAAALFDGAAATNLTGSTTSPFAPAIAPSGNNSNDTYIGFLFGGALTSTTISGPATGTSILNVAGSATQPLFGAAFLPLTTNAAASSMVWTLGTGQATLGVSALLLQGPTIDLNRWPDLAPPDRSRGMKYQRGHLSVGFYQVWFPHAPWDDFAKRAALRTVQFPLPVLGFPPPQVWFPPDVYSDIVPTRAKPVVDFIPWTFLEPAPQVWFPHDAWADFVSKQKPVADFKPWSFVAPTLTTPWTQWSPWTDVIRARAVQQQSFIAQSLGAFQDRDNLSWLSQWSAPLARGRLIPSDQPFVPSQFPPPVQVWFPPNNWPDIISPVPGLGMKAMRGRMSVGFSQVWYPPGNWPDSAPAARRPVELPQPVLVQLVGPIAPPTMDSWLQWPDFARRTASPTDPQSFAFLALTPSANVIGDWPDFILRAHQANFDQFSFVPLQAPPPPPAFTQWFPWPDIVPIRARPVTDFRPWSFVEPAPQIWFPHDAWPDTAPRARRAAEFAAFVFTPQTIIPPAPPLGYVQWPDFIYKKRSSLNYDPLTLVQTVKTPWNTLSTWPDFVPIRSKAGLHASLQQFAARFPGTITQATITAIMSAFEINSDSAIFAISVLQSQPAVTAAVSIQEVSGQSATSIHEAGNT